MIVFEEAKLRLLGNGAIVQMRLDEHRNECPLLVARICYCDARTAEKVRGAINVRWQAIRNLDTPLQRKHPMRVCNLPTNLHPSGHE